MPSFEELRKKLSRSDLPQRKDYGLLNPYKFDRAILIDVHNLAWKAHHAKVWSTFTTKSNVKSGHVFGAFTKIYSMITHHCIKAKKPSSLVFVWDEYKDKQLALYPEYKGNRPDRKENPVPDVIEMLSLFPHVLASIPSKDEEADSIIASYIYKNKMKEHFVLTSDRDMWQLWNKVRIFDTASTEFKTKDYESAFGTIPCKMIPLYKAIFGDTSDNIPPVIYPDTIVGKMTREEIIAILSKIKKPSEFVNHVKELKNPKHVKKITHYIDQIKTMYKVAKLHKDADIEVVPNEGNYTLLKELMLNKWECPSKMAHIDTLIKL